VPRGNPNIPHLITLHDVVKSILGLKQSSRWWLVGVFATSSTAAGVCAAAPPTTFCAGKAARSAATDCASKVCVPQLLFVESSLYDIEGHALEPLAHEQSADQENNTDTQVYTFIAHMQPQ
jgi:hypothetical protein